MAKTATFEIVINGIKESISAVDSLNKQLDALEKRVEALAKKNVNISASGGGSNTKALDEEAKMLQKIDELHQKVAASEKAEYQELLHAKEELKEYQTIAKSLAAQENLKAGVNDTSTMMGAKAQLRDLKAAMQTVDMDGDQFKQWAAEANELTQKLKEAEASYGQFGRNVGNYANGVAEGMQKVVIKVGETEREFKDARDASRTLNNELKAMALNGQQGTKAYEELDEAVKQMNSTIKDVSKSSVAMDNLLDTMEGVVAISSMAEGLGALFGIDDEEIQKSIQKLVALQNVLQGLETIQKQMQTQEGIGSWLSKGNAAIDKFAAGLLKAEKNAKLLAGGLKLLGGAAIVAAIIAITVAIDKMKKSVENMRDTINKNMDGFEAGAQAYAKAKVELDGYIRKIDEFKGSKKAEKQLIEEVTKKYDIHNKNIKDVKDLKEFLIKMAPAYLESVRAEAETMAYAAAQANLYAKNLVLLEKQKRLEAFLDRNGGFFGGPAVAQAAEDLREIENELKENAAAIEELGKKTEEAGKKAAEAQKKLVDLGVGGGKETEKKVKDNSKKIEEATRQAQENINALKIKLMKDGFYKELAQLDENNRKEIEKIKKNGQNVEEELKQQQLKLQQENYENELEELRKKYLDSLVDSNETNSINNASEAIQRLKEEWESLYLVMNRPTSTKDAPLFGLQEETAGVAYEQLLKWKDLYDIRNDELSKNNWEGYFDALKKQYLPKAAKEIQDEFNRLLAQTRPDSFDGYLENDVMSIKDVEKEAYVYLKQQFEEETSELKYFLTKYQGDVEMTERGITQTLENSYLERASLISERYRNMLGVTNQYIQDKLALDVDSINKEEKLEKSAAEKRLKTTKEGYEKLLSQSKKYSAYTSESVAEYLRTKEDLTDEEKNLQVSVKLIDEQEKEITQIVQKYTNQRKALQLNANNEMQQNNAKYYDKAIAGIEEYMQKASDILSNQPEKVGLFNITDITASKKQYNEVLNLYKQMEDDLTATTYEALKAVNSSDPATKISGEQFERIMQNVEFYKKKIKESTVEIKQNMKDLLPNLLNDINFWIQQVGQAATQVIQSIGQINDAAFEKEMEALDRQTEYYEKQLEKQKEITQKYADDVDDIESELSESRGDRRQFLIDQLNAQMAAQRASLAQEKQIEKEQERIDKKKKALEYQNEMRKWEQSKLTAAISAALAISNAAVNSWPIPAIPMMALATAVGAAQMAAVMAAKPRKYAKGGLLDGPSHSQGGIKAGNVELEGNEYVVNKHTAMQNLPLMNFINSRKKRIDLDDIVEFYSSGIRKNVSIANKTKFASGGMLPTLRSDVDFEGNVLRAIERYNNRNIVVSVVDIINKSESVRQVQTLAGLS